MAIQDKEARRRAGCGTHAHHTGQQDNFLPLTLSYRPPTPNIRALRQKAEDTSRWVRAEAEGAHPSEDLGVGVR